MKRRLLLVVVLTLSGCTSIKYSADEVHQTTSILGFSDEIHATDISSDGRTRTAGRLTHTTSFPGFSRTATYVNAILETNEVPTQPAEGESE